MKRPSLRFLALFLTALMILSVYSPLQLSTRALGDDPVDIVEGTPQELTLASGEYAYYRFVPTETNTYAFWSESDNDTICELYDSVGGTRLKSDDDSGEGHNFKLVYKLTAGTEYFYRCAYYSTHYGTMTVKVALTHNFRKTLTTAPTATEPGVFTTTCTYDGCTYSSTEETALGVPITSGETVTIPKGDPEVSVPVVFDTPTYYHRFELDSANNNNVQTFVRRWMVGDHGYYDVYGSGDDRNFHYSDNLNENKTYVFFCRPNPDDDYTVTLTMAHGDNKYLTAAPTSTDPGEFTHRCGQCDYSYTESIPAGLILTEGSPVTIPAGDPSVLVPVVFTSPDEHKYRVFSSDNGGKDVALTKWSVGSSTKYEYVANTSDCNADYTTNYNEGESYVFFCRPIADQSYTLNIEKSHSFSKTITRMPSLTAEGEYTFKCDRCDESYTEAIPRAVEIHEGETLDIAENGSDVYAVAFTPTASHKYTIESSDKAGGADPYVSLYFGGTTRRIDYNDDSAGDWNFSLAAALDEGRTYIYLCKMSAGWTYKVTLSSPHDYTKTLTLAPTASEPGEFTYNCKYCDDSYTEAIPSGIVIAAGETVTIPAGDPNVLVPVVFKPEVTHSYRFASSDNGGNTTKTTRWLVGSSDAYDITGYYNNSYNFLTDFNGGSDMTFVYLCRPIASRDYKVTLSMNHNYNKQLTKLPTTTEEGDYTYTCTNCDDSYTEAIPVATAINVGETVTITSPANENIIVPLVFTPETTHRYVIESSNYVLNEDDPYVTMYGSDDPSKSVYNDDGGDHYNFKLPVDLTAGVTYVFFCRVKRSEGYQIDLTMPHEYDRTLTTLPTADSTGTFTYKCKYCEDTYTETIPNAVVILPGDTLTVPQGESTALYPVCFTTEFTHGYDLISSDNNGAQTGFALYRLGADKVADHNGSGTDKTFDYSYRYDAEAQYLFMMRPSPESSYKVTLSYSHSYESALTRMPTADAAGEITYQCKDCSDTYTESVPPAVQLAEDGEVTLTGEAGQKFAAITFTPTHSHSFVMESSDNSGIDPRAILYSADSLTRLVIDDDSGSGYNFKITRELEAGKTYILLCRCIEGSSQKVSLKAPHNYVSSLTQLPTATTRGMITYQCSSCDDSYTVATSPLVELQSGETITIPAGGESELVPVRFCSDVVHNYYVTSDNNDGKTVSGFEMVPGEEEPYPFSGLSYYSNNVSLFRNVTPETTVIYFFRRIEGVNYTLTMTPYHTYKRTLTTMPTVSEPGVFTHTCACGESYTKPIPKALEIHDDERLLLTGNDDNVIPILFTAPKNGTFELISDSTYGDKPYGTLYLDGTQTVSSSSVGTSSFAIRAPLEAGKTYLYLVTLNKNSLCAVTMHHIHTYEREITTSPTCTTDGLATYTCSYCGDAHTRVMKNRHVDADLNAVCDLCGEQIKFAEIAIVVDTTGSMGVTLTQIKQKISAAVDVLEDAGYNYRLALVDYRDFAERSGAKDYPYDVKQDFTDDPEAVYNAVQLLTTGDGGDYEETVFSALTDGLRSLSWSTASWKGVILVGDAPPLDPEPFTNYTMDQVTTLLTGDPVTGDSGVIDPVYPGQIIHVNSITTGKTTPLNSFQQISDNTGGNSYGAGSKDIGDIIIEIFEGLTTDTHYHTPTIAVPGRSATCSQVGLTDKIVCSECGETIREQTEIPMIAHTYGEQIDAKYLKVEATCTSRAIYYRSCTTCGAKSTETFFGEASAGHKWTENADPKYLKTSASCTEKAVYYKSCSVCGAKGSETFAYGNPNGHGATEVRDAKSAGCGTTGYTGDSYCRVCGEKVGTGAVTAALGHDFGAWTKLDGSMHQRVCSRDASHVEKAEHVWDGGKVTKEAEVGKSGEKTFTCTVCGATRTETIPALDAPVTEPPATEPPATEPPASEPPA
ncbi:MAG: VWA domain-containing protein, partial [Clostridia bacterium]|nr:VWA domain-containing protein [Clostridia bacterium]